MTSPVPPRQPTPFDADDRPVVAVFRAPLFNASETFVRAQAAGLERYQPLVVGLERKGQVPHSLDGRILVADGLAQRLAIRLAGHWGELGREIAARRPVLVHAHFGPDGLAALPLAISLGVPLVTTLRGYEIGRSRAALLRSGRLSWMRYALGRERLMRGGALFLAVSDALRGQAVAQGYPAERTLTHYNGVDLDAFPAGAEDDGETILHVGRLVEKKGTAVLLRAFAQLPEKAARLAIIGDGPLRRPLERLAEELGVSGRVGFLGALPPEEVGGWMRRAAVVAAPSVTARDGDAEGLANVVVEAAASARPVVASDHPGMNEAVIDGETGFLVAEGEAAPLARRLSQLLGDRGLRRRMGLQGRTLAERRFDAAAQMRRLESLYDTLLAGGSPTSTSAIETR
jgi:glycosyltransferase involved in cell wall biosynthesis